MVDCPSDPFNQVDSDAELLMHYGSGPGPEVLPEPRSLEETARHERIWCYAQDVFLRQPIRFCPRGVPLAPPKPTAPHRPLHGPAAERAALDRIAAVLENLPFPKETHT